MPDETRSIFSLYRVCKDIEKTIDKRYNYGYWIKAEINKLNHYTRSGHSYPELVEKKAAKVVAQIRGVIWETDFKRIDQKFRQIAGEPLKEDIKILCYAYIDFHPQYGLSLKIRDIDPHYTMGDLMQAKNDTIAKLKSEQLLHQQKKLELPALPQRIAIISVETSKGYADFINVLDQAQEAHQIGFFRHLFPAILQGDKAVQTILKQLSHILKVKHHFDVVAIIRGGGGEVGLSCFNDYQLAKTIAQFPLPVFTGIGHSTNLTVAEMVAHYNAITPTKIATYLIEPLMDQQRQLQTFKDQLSKNSVAQTNYYQQQLQELKKQTHQLAHYQLVNQKQQLNQLQQSTHIQANFRLKNENQHISRQANRLNHLSLQYIRVEKQEVDDVKKALRKNARQKINHYKDDLKQIRRNIYLLKPEQVLKRGFSITRFKGKAITKIEDLKNGDQIDTQLYDGKVVSEVKAKNNK
ncbi:MAG: exodeoxyribonuclease VII large subunit [Psychroflexus sp.]|nr:exodeoxyribonuclease VII large subunit [Psychroflexus sp.]MDR9448704.1 exodeoxyribonuclease VII large subunit [Psychroflexus sp.]